MFEKSDESSIQTGHIRSSISLESDANDTSDDDNQTKRMQSSISLDSDANDANHGDNYP